MVEKKGYNDADFSNYIVVMEENNQSIFDSAYGYDSTVLVRSIYDIDKDGMKELHGIKKFRTRVINIFFIKKLLILHSQLNYLLSLILGKRQIVRKIITFLVIGMEMNLLIRFL